MGSERESSYIEIARERIAGFFNGTLRLRPLGKPVHVPSGNEKVARLPEEWTAEQSQRKLFERKGKYK